MSELVNALLQASGAERVDRLQEASLADLEQAIPELGRRHEPAAAELLQLIDDVVTDRGLRKAARRELHRLESAGIHPSATTKPATSQAAAEARPGPTVQVGEAWATEIDPAGSRALWIMGEPPLGGAWLAAMVLNEQDGLTDLTLVETTRKRYQRQLEQQRQIPGAIWVELPPEYALALIREAVDTARSRERGLPTRYHSFKELFGEAEHGPERALVYNTVSPLEATFNPDLLADSARLLRNPEVGGWHVPAPPELRARVAEVTRPASVALVVPGNTPEEKALRLVQDAAREALTDERRRMLRRRLEETAYIFVTTDRLAEARLAVASARGLDDPTLGPERHPFVRALLISGLVGGPKAEVGEAAAGMAETLMALVERAVEREPGRPETTRTGLILPR